MFSFAEQHCGGKQYYTTRKGQDHARLSKDDIKRSTRAELSQNLKKTLKKVLTKRGEFDKIYKLLARGAPNLENDTERDARKNDS